MNSEEEPTVQTYKGYVVDTQMKSSTIYIDQENNVVLAQVRYTQTQLQKKYDYTNAQTNVESSRTIRIRFSKQDGKYLVNHIDPILIVDSLNASEKASIPSLNKPITNQTQSTEREKGTMTKLETLEKQKQKAEDRLADYMTKAKKEEEKLQQLENSNHSGQT